MIPIASDEASAVGSSTKGPQRWSLAGDQYLADRSRVYGVVAGERFERGWSLRFRLICLARFLKCGMRY